ncbi:hypothetical protein F66182_4640 [Fusarium sp. NRRL 66182]|nr:hypothetical protein F66182_4640 [Fusarium sp. NRRL 66182]
MHRSAALLTLGALSSPATAAWFKSNHEPSWSPPRQTGIYAEEAGEQAQIALGWTPVPTDAPKLSGAMDMDFVLGKRQLDENTCGFVSGTQLHHTVDSTQKHVVTDMILDRLFYMYFQWSCNVVKTTCVDYAESASVCQVLADFHTLCCQLANVDISASTAPSCFSWIGTSGGDTYTLLDCSATSGTSSLLFSDPLAQSDTTSARDSSTTDTASDEASSTTDDNAVVTVTGSAGTSSSSGGGGGGGGDDGPNVGAIAGGAVGGVAALALVGLAGFLLFRRRRRTTPAATPIDGDGSQGPPAMAQAAHSPGNSYVPTSPSNATYPSGVPSNFQGGYQQAYDPNLAAPYGQPQGYQQPGYGGYSPQPQNFPNQYSQQGFGQQSQYPSPYGAGGYGVPSTASPPPQTQYTPSPGPKDGTEVPHDGQQHPQQQEASELPAVNPLGREGNRAELG